MGMIKGGLGCLAAIASCLVSFMALAIIIITAFKLQSVSFEVDNVTLAEASCLLGSDPTSGSNCILLEVVGGITIALGLAVGLVQCLTCHLCGLGGILDAIFAAVGTVLWIGTAVTVQKGNNATNDMYLQDVNYNWRQTVVVLSWVECGMFILILLVAFMKCCCRGK